MASSSPFQRRGRRAPCWPICPSRRTPVARSELCDLLWDAPSDPRGELRWSLSKIRRLVDQSGRCRIEYACRRHPARPLGLPRRCDRDHPRDRGGHRDAAPWRGCERCPMLLAGDFLDGLEDRPLPDVQQLDGRAAAPLSWRPRCDLGASRSKHSRRSRPAACCGAWSSITRQNTPVGSTWLRSKSAYLSRQCLDRRIDSYARLVSETAAWEKRRNAERAKINWMFTTEKARAKLGRAYPKVPAKPNEKTKNQNLCAEILETDAVTDSAR